ncbi:MAG: small basic family protein [Firmicutes bacterium]|nr:small basic family protein [Bacillota bacterium]
MLLPLIGLILGLLAGSLFTMALPGIIAKYLSIAVLASLDSLLGGWRAVLEDTFDGSVLITGFFINALLAASLAYLGDLLGLDLYLAAVITFGIRIFNNLGALRHSIVLRMRQNNLRRTAQKRRAEEARQFNPLKQYEELSQEDQD